MAVMAKTAKIPKRDPNEIRQVLIRIPQWLYEAIETDANEEARTVNMHVVWLVRQRVRAKAAEKAAQDEAHGRNA